MVSIQVIIYKMKVTVIIPFNKDRGYLKHAIDSVKNQTYKNVELILCKSKDGVSKNINKGFEYATGDVVGYFAEDDLLCAKTIEHVVNGIGDYDFIHGKAIRFDKETNTIYKPLLKYPSVKDLIKNNYIHGGTCWYKSHVIKENRFDESLWTAEEYEYHLRLLSKSYEIGFIDEVIFKYRLHQNQKSIGNLDKEYQAKRNNVKQLIKNKYVVKNY
jgi:glycosyltransferase involved in cell wall biosynthesis